MIKFLFYLFVSVISTFGFSYVYYVFNGRPYFDKFRIAFIFVLGVLFLTFVRYYDLLVISSISYFLFYPIMYYNIDHQSRRRFFFYLIIIWIYGMLFDLLSMIIVSGLYTLYDINVSNSVLFQALPSIIVFGFLLLISQNKFIIRFNSYFYNLCLKIEYLDFALVSFIFLVFISCISIAINIKYLSNVLLIVIVIFLMLLCFVLIVKNKLNNYENKIYLKTLKENNDFYITMDAENRIFKHNLAAKLLGIKSVSNKKARALIDDILIQYIKNGDFTNHIHMD